MKDRKKIENALIQFLAIHRFGGHVPYFDLKADVQSALDQLILKIEKRAFKIQVQESVGGALRITGEKVKKKMILLIRGEQARRGMKIKTFDGEECRLIDWREPHKPSSTGRVIVEFPYPEGDSKVCPTREFFPSVVGGVWKEVF